MTLRRLNIIHWPISLKLTAIFLIVILLPTLIVQGVFVRTRRADLAREQNTIRIETLGTLEITRVEQALHNLSLKANQLTAPPDTAALLASYTAQEEPSSSLKVAIETKFSGLIRGTPSLSRIRLFNAEGTLMVEGVKRLDSFRLRFDPASSIETPADTLIPTITAATTISDIYLDDINDPSLDVIVRLSSGVIVFTFDLIHETLDFYTTLNDFPTDQYPVYVFLLNQEGRLMSPSDRALLQADGRKAESFQAAQRGTPGATTYYSPLLSEDVLGYARILALSESPKLTLVIETPMTNINQAASEESALSLVAGGGTLLLVGILGILLTTSLIARPITQLAQATRRAATRQTDTPFPQWSRQDELGTLNTAIIQVRDQFSVAVHDLERSVDERTRRLETVLEIGQVLTSIRDLDELLEELVNLIRNQFAAIYHVQVFLIDPRTNQAQLRASTGPIGRKLLQRGHYLDVGSQSVIGSVTASGYAVVALDTSNNPIHRRNEFLPDTRAEMALPLRLGENVIGALDLQSTQPDAFSEQDVGLFQGMADQITIAIENALLFAESNARLEEIERLNRSLTEKVWRETERTHTARSLSAGAGQHMRDAGDWSALQLEAMEARHIAERFDGDWVTFAVPVILRGLVLGAVEWQVPLTRYSADTRQTAIELTARLALTSDNIRLFEQSRRVAQREHLVNEIASKLTGTTDIDQILQTAVRELGLALRSPHTAIQLTPPADEPTGPRTTPALDE